MDKISILRKIANNTEQYKNLSNFDLEFSEKDLLNIANVQYRIGNPLISDKEFDFVFYSIYNERSNELMDDFENSGFEKTKLPINMGSMEKEKTISSLKKWVKLKQTNSKFNLEEEEFVITPKYDGLSLLENFNSTNIFSRGDGEIGRILDIFLKKLNLNKDKNYKHELSYHEGYYNDNCYFCGEAIMNRKLFVEKYKDNWEILSSSKKPYENPRNLVGGKFNDLIPSDIVKDIQFIRYSFINPKEKLSKKKQLEICNSVNEVKVPYVIQTLKSISDEGLLELFEEWSKEYEIDGLIIEFNRYEIREELGFETNSFNPCYARAYKGNFEEQKESIVNEIVFNVNKDGEINPVLKIDPIYLDGVEVSSIYGDNMRTMYCYGIGIGTKLTVKRSGMVIPRITKVENVNFLTPKIFNEIWKSCNNNLELTRNKINQSNNKFSLPDIYNKKYSWNNEFTQIVLNDFEYLENVKKQRIIYFFETLKISEVSDNTINDFFNRGYDSIEKILGLTIDVMEKWSGWKNRKATIVYNEIQKCITNIPIERLMSATNMFKGMAEEKIKFSKHLWFKNNQLNSNWTYYDLLKVDGYSEISANNFQIGFSNFKNVFDSFLKCGISIEDETNKEVEQIKTDGIFKNEVIVFTMFRNESWEKIIKNKGGSLLNGISKKATILVIKEKGVGSKKEEKALELGIKIYDEKEFSEFYNLEKELNNKSSLSSEEIKTEQSNNNFSIL